MPFTQENRQIRVETPLGKDVLMLESFRGIEGVSMPFRFQLDLVSESSSINLASLLHKPVKIFIQTANREERCIHGRVSRMVQQGRVKELTHYQAEVVPWIWFLSLASNCRIFQNKSVPDIVKKVFQDAGFSDFELSLTGSYSPRVYCVQYRESDLNFVSRLLEEEGIFYFFKHSEEKHVLVLADSGSAVQPCLHQSAFRCIGGALGTPEEDVVNNIYLEHRIHTGKSALTDYDFEKPSSSLLTNVGEKQYEVYDYPGRYTVKADGDKYVRIRLEEFEANRQMVQGNGTCRPMTAGHKFDLKEHYLDDMNQSYMLVSVEHHARGAQYTSEDRGGFEYQNTFTAIPASVPYRPPRTARKPIVHGAQTAMVVGKSGEEIWVDKYGRVKVQFHWDREGNNDEQSSCWVRVSQVWAGKTWGAIHIPRIGQEVIVDFLEGDPDQPIITGRVYNAESMPPYELPANQTQSGIKSRSSKQGGSANFNELRFEDKKGSEEIYMHAEKNLTTKVENDEVRDVDHDRTTTIKRHDTQIIKEGDETLTIEKGKQTETIEQDQTLLIKMGNRSITLDMGNQSRKIKMGNESTKIDLGKSEKEAMQSIELKVGQSSIKIDQMGVTIKGMMIKVEGQINVEVKGGVMTKVEGSAMLIAKGGITMIN